MKLLFSSLFVFAYIAVFAQNDSVSNSNDNFETYKIKYSDNIVKEIKLSDNLKIITIKNDSTHKILINEVYKIDGSRFLLLCEKFDTLGNLEYKIDGDFTEKIAEKTYFLYDSVIKVNRGNLKLNTLSYMDFKIVKDSVPVFSNNGKTIISYRETEVVGKKEVEYPSFFFEEVGIKHLVINNVDTVIKLGNGYYKGLLKFIDFIINDENSMVIVEGEYKDGVPYGIFKGHYSNNQLYFEEKYSNNSLEGISYDKEGNSYKYSKVFESPNNPNLSEFLKNNIVYPVLAKENDIQGKVTVSFWVAVDGSISDAKIESGVDRLLDREALRVVAMLNSGWTPAILRGQFVKAKVNLPFNFKLF